MKSPGTNWGRGLNLGDGSADGDKWPPAGHVRGTDHRVWLGLDVKVSAGAWVAHGVAYRL